MSEATSNEERAYEIIESVLTGFPEFRQSIVENALTAAEERGRQSARNTVGLVMECRQEALDENKRLRDILNSQPPSEWADLGELTGEALRGRLRSRSEEWRSAAKTLEQCMLSDRPDLQLLIDMIDAKAGRLTAEVERLGTGDGPAGKDGGEEAAQRTHPYGHDYFTYPNGARCTECGVEWSEEANETGCPRKFSCAPTTPVPPDAPPARPPVPE